MPKKLDYSTLYTLRSDGRYQGYWRDEDGKRHALCDRDPARLHARLAEKEAPKTLTFRDLAERWEAAYRETVTTRTWKNMQPHYEAMLDKWGSLPVEAVTATEIIADLQAAKAKGYSRTVVNTRKVVITGILNRALADGIIPYNPALSVQLPKGLPHGKRTAPDDAVIRAVLAGKDLPFGFFPFLLLCTGMRKSEALALRKSDIDTKKALIHVDRALTYISNSAPQTKPPKSGKPREIAIPSILAAPLEAYISPLKKNDLLFRQPPSNRSRGGGYFSEHSYEHAWLNYCRAANLLDADGKPLITAHHLRHATATLLYEADVDVYTAQRILGHSKVSTTMEIYTDLRDKKQAESVAKFSEMMAKKMAGTENIVK